MDNDETALSGGLIARASFPAALRQAAGGWRPAPLHSWPKGRRPFRESRRRRPDPWWPLQTSKRLPLVPLDIFFPAQSGSPLLPVTISRFRSDYALRRNPFRAKGTKVNLRQRQGMEAGACSAPGTKGAGSEARAGFAASVLAEEFSGFLVDEMKPGTGEADDGHMGIGTGLILRRGCRKPMLHVGAQPRAFEKDMPAHTREYAELAWRVTSVWLRSWKVPAGEMRDGAPRGAGLFRPLAAGFEVNGALI